MKKRKSWMKASSAENEFIPQTPSIQLSCEIKTEVYAFHLMM